MLSAFAGGSMFGQRFGVDPVEVVALHGWRRSHVDFVGLLDEFNAIALDLPGFGASPEPPTAWGADLYAQHVAKVIEDFPQPPVVIGHSFGGRIAVALAAQRPELVRAIVVTGAPLIRTAAPAKPPLAFRLAKWANSVGWLSDDTMERQRRSRGSADYRAATGVMREVFVRVVNESYEDELKRVQCPAEFVWGELDTAAPVGQARIAATLVPDCTLEVLPGVTHWTLSERPENIRTAIRKHLS